MNDNEKKLIKKSNASILRRLQRGESLANVPPEATWFPPRPLLSKNKEDIEKLYGIKKEKVPPLCIIQQEDHDKT